MNLGLQRFRAFGRFGRGLCFYRQFCPQRLELLAKLCRGSFCRRCQSDFLFFQIRHLGGFDRLPLFEGFCLARCRSLPFGQFRRQPRDIRLGAFGLLGHRGLGLRAAFPVGRLLARLGQLRLQPRDLSPGGLFFLGLPFQFSFAFAHARDRARVFIHLLAHLFEFFATGHQLPPNGRQIAHGFVAIGAGLAEGLFQVD